MLPCADGLPALDGDWPLAPDLDCCAPEFDGDELLEADFCEDCEPDWPCDCDWDFEPWLDPEFEDWELEELDWEPDCELDLELDCEPDCEPDFESAGQDELEPELELGSLGDEGAPPGLGADGGLGNEGGDEGEEGLREGGCDCGIAQPAANSSASAAGVSLSASSR